MDKFSWLEIDGVHYEYHAERIDCHTDVGYSYSFPGSRLEDIEITDASGKLVGFFSADFSDGALSFTPSLPIGEIPIQQGILMGDGVNSEYKEIGELPIVAEYHTLFVAEDEPVPVWDSMECTALSTDSMTALPLSLVLPEDETLDAFFGESSAVRTDSYLPDTTSSAYVADLSSIYLEHGVDSFLMPMLPEQIDPSSVI